MKALNRTTTLILRPTFPVSKSLISKVERNLGRKGSTGSAALLHSRGFLVLVMNMESPFAGSWIFPSGGVEKNETPEQSCIREVREETGLEATIEKLLCLIKPINIPGMVISLYKCNGIGEIRPGRNINAVGLFRYPPPKDTHPLCRDILKKFKNELCPHSFMT